MSEEPYQKLRIRELLENWVVWSDAGDWERFRTVWHDDGHMMATWCQGSADYFIEARREGFNRGVTSILHFLGGSSIELAGKFSVAARSSWRASGQSRKRK